MPYFAYKAINKLGKEISDVIETAGYDDAVRRLRGMGLFPTEVKARREKTKPGAGGSGAGMGLNMELKIPFLGIGVVKSAQVTLFTRQLSTLLGAGLPLVRSLNVLRDQIKPCEMQRVLNSLSGQVEAGSTFSDSLLKYPRIFNKLFVNTVKDGEMGGVMEVVLSRLADFNEKAEKLQKKIQAALVYPAVVVVIAMGVVGFLLVFVIPKFMELFKELGTELPLPTLMLLRLTEFIQHQWYIVIGLVIGVVVFFNTLMKFPGPRYHIDSLKLRVPVMGLLIQKLSIARFSRTLCTLIASGVPILQALVITKDTAGNEVVAKSLQKVHDSIREGESIAGPLGKTRIFPLMVVNMINVGEETGSLDQMLNKIADTYEDEVVTTVGALTSLLEPLLIVFMGLMVGAIVICMFLPLVKLLTTLSA